MDLEHVQAQLAASKGRDFWRGLDELAQTEAFQTFLHREFPRQASEWLPSLSRRQFLQLMGASLAMGGLAACSPAPEKIVPYVHTPEDTIPGQPLFFATAMQLGGYALGLLAQSQLGRPTKLEGNPDHPASLGATDAFAQASVLTLYDPDRAQTVMHAGAASSWEEFLPALRQQLDQQRAKDGAGLRILTETVTSPTLFAQLQAILTQFPNAVWHQFEPVNRDNVYAGAQLAFRRRRRAGLSHRPGSGDCEPGRRLYERSTRSRSVCARFCRRPERAEAPADRIRNRLYVVESSPTLAGASADHRLSLPARAVESFARMLAAELGVALGDAAQPSGVTIPSAWIGAVARDLQAHAGASLVLAGDHQPPAVHALAHAINDQLGNAGKTVIYTEPVAASPAAQTQSLRELVDAMGAGQVDMLLILDANPAYSAPADIAFAQELAKAPFRVHMGLYADETAALCQWQLPATHYLESWSDARAYDGTITIQQPLIAPLYGGRSLHELLDALTAEQPRSDHDIVQAYWLQQQGQVDFATFWSTTLHDGLVADSALPAKEVALRPLDLGPMVANPAADALELNFRPDPTIWDGRFANNGWLQELPKPLTKLTWENAAMLSPTTAAALGLVDGDVVELAYQGRTVQAPIWLMPGHCEGAVTVTLGYGRAQAGQVGNEAGFNAYRLRPAEVPWFGTGLTVSKIGIGRELASTQTHNSMEGRNLVRTGTVDQAARDPGFVQAMDEHAPNISLFPKPEPSEYAWGMAIDLSACNGCNACVTACQAENNIPIVGKEQVIKGREMQWIRIDRYYAGEPADPETYHQPVLCMHCENAPCEVVCPVAATTHDHEGLNTMVYNRCIGTRYCSNNCPYKVRRFNFLEFTDFTTESLKLQRNPNVTVRSRGVMEKCTYCVQRINAARITAKLDDHPIGDGDVVTACQAACPTQAIVFGNISDPESRVAKLKASQLNYGMLTELNTHPRTTYLAALRNPNPELAQAEVGERFMTAKQPEPADYIVAPGHTYRSITERITGLVLTRSTPRLWFAGMALALAILLVFLYAVAHLLTTGIGIWGNNQPVGWGFDITSMVWWIGIAHAGTLISAILLLFRQAWRTSINRFAEAMTLFAILCASMYPILHVGRPWLAYWIFPIPSTLALWPQFRSPLVWDAFAIGTYALVSLLFWFIGLIPDLAAMRDRAQNKWARYFYGILAMGWRGEAGHWQRYETAYLLLAALATALVISVHSVVSFDFAVGVIPGWHSTVFPPYFVAGAIFSGFAMVLTLLIPLRKIYRLEDFITNRHLDNMAKVMLATGLFVIYGYLTEAFMAWYSGNPVERFWLYNRTFGPYWWAFWALMLCNVLIPQALWFTRVRSTPILLFLVAIAVDIGMWIERYVIIVGGLHRDFLPSSWGIFSGTIYDWATIIGTIGLFVFLVLLFIRVLPMISMFEMRHLVAPNPEPEPPDAGTQPASSSRTNTAPAAANASVYGLMAEFDTAHALVEKAQAAYQAGYRKITAYSPFPIEELPAVLGLKRPKLPFLALIGGIAGAVCGFAMQYYIAVIDNPWNVGGRPLNSWPSFIIVTFEMTILFAAGVTALGMIFGNRLPQPYHAVFNAPRFRFASQDRFFLCIEAADPHFDQAKTLTFLESLQPAQVVEVEK